MIHIRDYSAIFPLTPREIAKLADHCRIDENECWIWIGTRRANGYGQVGLRGSLWFTHRLFYELLIGHVPEGDVLDHLCRVTLCCNPFHLQPVAHLTNICRGNVHSGADHYLGSRTHCIHGHPLSGDNVHYYTIGGRHRQRVCRACSARNTAAYRRRKRQALRQSSPALHRGDSLTHPVPAMADVLGDCSDCQFVGATR
jgi:hypothetical protein